MGEPSKTPGIERIVRKYDKNTGNSNHPFDGEYTRLAEPVMVGKDGIPGDLCQLCMLAKKQPVQTYAFHGSHRYDLSSLRDVVDLDTTLKNRELRGGRDFVSVRLKAKGHGPASRQAVLDVYHAFIADPEKEADVVENGDSEDCQE